MRHDSLRNFTVRFLDSALQRVETTAKPFYGGRSTGEAIRRLAEERLEEIANGEGAEQSGEALLRLVSDWQSGSILPIADLRFLALSATEAYRRCTAEFVSRHQLIAVVSAFCDAVKECTRGAGTGAPLRGRYSLPGRAGEVSAADSKELLRSVERWLAKLPALVTPSQAEQASRNLSVFLREERWPDEVVPGRVLRLHVNALLQLSIRGYWQQRHRPLIGPDGDARRKQPRDLAPLRQGRITLEASVRDYELWLAIELPNHTRMLANDLVEIEDVRNVIRLAVERGDGRGEVFSCSKEFGKPERFHLSTERCRWVLECADVISIAEALEALLREPSIANLVERGRYIYGCL